MAIKIVVAIANCFYIYLMMIFIRCFLTWFPGLNWNNPILKALASSVDLYLDLFRKFKKINMPFFLKTLYLLIFFVSPIYYNITKLHSDVNINVWDSMIFTKSIYVKYIVLLISILGYIFLIIGLNFSNKKIKLNNNLGAMKKMISNEKVTNYEKKYKITVITIRTNAHASK